MDAARLLSGPETAAALDKHLRQVLPRAFETQEPITLMGPSLAGFLLNQLRESRGNSPIEYQEGLTVVGQWPKAPTSPTQALQLVETRTGRITRDDTLRFRPVKTEGNLTWVDASVVSERHPERPPTLRELAQSPGLNFEKIAYDPSKKAFSYDRDFANFLTTEIVRQANHRTGEPELALRSVEKARALGRPHSRSELGEILQLRNERYRSEIIGGTTLTELKARGLEPIPGVLQLREEPEGVILTGPELRVSEDDDAQEWLTQLFYEGQEETPSYEAETLRREDNAGRKGVDVVISSLRLKEAIATLGNEAAKEIIDPQHPAAVAWAIRTDQLDTLLEHFGQDPRLNQVLNDPYCTATLVQNGLIDKVKDRIQPEALKRGIGENTYWANTLDSRAIMLDRLGKVASEMPEIKALTENAKWVANVIRGHHSQEAGGRRFLAACPESTRKSTEVLDAATGNGWKSVLTEIYGSREAIFAAPKGDLDKALDDALNHTERDIALRYSPDELVSYLAREPKFQNALNVDTCRRALVEQAKDGIRLTEPEKTWAAVRQGIEARAPNAWQDSGELWQLALKWVDPAVAGRNWPADRNAAESLRKGLASHSEPTEAAQWLAEVLSHATPRRQITRTTR